MSTTRRIKRNMSATHRLLPLVSLPVLRLPVADGERGVARFTYSLDCGKAFANATTQAAIAPLVGRPR